MFRYDEVSSSAAVTGGASGVALRWVELALSSPTLSTDWTT
jgi:hypothetical protein